MCFLYDRAELRSLGVAHSYRGETRFKGALQQALRDAIADSPHAGGAEGDEGGGGAAAAERGDGARAPPQKGRPRVPPGETVDGLKDALRALGVWFPSSATKPYLEARGRTRSDDDVAHTDLVPSPLCVVTVTRHAVRILYLHHAE